MHDRHVATGSASTGARLHGIAFTCRVLSEHDALGSILEREQAVGTQADCSVTRRLPWQKDALSLADVNSMCNARRSTVDASMRAGDIIVVTTHLDCSLSAVACVRYRIGQQ